MLVSVIIPVYKVENYLHKCVDSVLAQTYKNLQIILVDDGSPDKCPQICDEYASKDKRIEVIHQKNGGVSSARNHGIKFAKGEYISFIDSDDWVDKDFIETLVHLAKEHQAPVSVVGKYMVFPTKTVQYNILPKGKTKEIIETTEKAFSARQSLYMIFENYGYVVTNKLFRKELFKDLLFPEGLMYEDIWLEYYLFQKINKIVVYNIPLSYYNRLNENSISRGKFHRSMLDYFTVTDIFLKKAIELKDKKLIRQLKHGRLSHIIGFFRRMMLSDFNDVSVIKPLQKELRQNFSILILDLFPIMAICFGLFCCIDFNLTKRIYLLIIRATGKFSKEVYNSY